MKEKGRLILTGHSPAEFNMGLDEALAKLSEKPVFRYYGWDPSAVSIGYFQRVNREVDLANARKNGISVIRRITGGGAVYHDKHGEVTYSISLPKDHNAIPEDILESYRVLCSGISSGLANLGIESEFSPVNDLTVSGKKISGNAQTRRFGKVLQHGTILMKVDPDLMFSVLKVPDEKMKFKLIQIVKDRVTSLEKLGVSAEFSECGDALVQGFSQVLNIDFKPSEPTEEEMALAKELAREKYQKGEWNNKR